MTNTDVLEDKIIKLKQLYLKSLPEKIEIINQSWSNCTKQNKICDSLLEVTLHKLAGSAGMYDEHAVGELARELELLIAEQKGELSQDNISTINQGIKKLISLTTASYSR